ncbi:YdbT family protein [Tenacibaculum retecalamus]|uniref:hypothetical protein n=1 Tax=Tenacibaculum retecalamus TaxID=3018315 RepID=UPI0023D91E3D|nr:hypothetical protein [Tenacibaculum retecalamus]WBX70512.1 hypothetical protein PG912_09575 [Tenacibaculum retecalamus]
MKDNIILKFKPKQGVFFRFSDIVTIPFTTIIFLLSINWVKNIPDGNLMFFFLGILAVTTSFFYCFLRFFIDFYYRKNLEYILTEKQIIIKSKLIFKRRVEIDLETVSGIELYEYSRGFGNIYFGEKNPLDFYNFNGFHWTNQLFDRKISYSILEYIPDSKKIYSLIKEAKEKI